MLHSDNRTDHGRNFRSKWDGYKNNRIDGGILWEQCDVNNVKVGQDGMDRHVFIILSIIYVTNEGETCVTSS